MNPRDIVEARLAAVDLTITELFDKRGALIDKAASEKRSFTDTEQADYDSAGTARAAAEKDRGLLVERLAEIDEQEKREAAAVAVRKETGQSVGGAKVTDPQVYRKGGQESYFKDLYSARLKGDRESLDRLVRNDKMTDAEKRALGNTGATGGSGGEFAPPLWLISDFIALARPGRKFADSLNPEPLPKGVSSVNLPRVLTGTTTAVQSTQNTALSQTDMTTNSVSSGISTVGGKQVVSLQLLEQSGIPFDTVILKDLAMDYARSFDLQVISGSNASGQLNGVYTYFNASGSQNVTWTNAAPTVAGPNSLYSKIFNAASNIETSRYLPPDTAWMHPRRWNWILSAADTQNRPLVVPSGMAVNTVGVMGALSAQGVVGQIGSLDVITDPNIPTNLGAGTNQDPILVGVRGDLRVWESELQTDVFMEPYADSNGVLFRCFAYSAAIPGRYATSLAIINGTGSIAPTF